MFRKTMCRIYDNVFKPNIAENHNCIGSIAENLAISRMISFLAAKAAPISRNVRSLVSQLVSKQIKNKATED